MVESPVPLPIPRIVGARFTLRPFDVGDLALVEEAATDEYIPLITTVPRTYTPDEGLAFIERQHDRARSGVGYSLAIADQEDDRSVGQIGLWTADLAKGRAVIGYWVGASGRGRGAASEALDLIAGWAFANLLLRRLTLYVEPWNVASIKVAERAGFEREALLRSWQLVDGQPKDMFSFVSLG
jgi:ribosomal-protein-alanine N-acetyltransferase